MATGPSDVGNGSRKQLAICGLTIGPKAPQLLGTATKRVGVWRPGTAAPDAAATELAVGTARVAPNELPREHSLVAGAGLPLLSRGAGGRSCFAAEGQVGTECGSPFPSALQYAQTAFLLPLSVGAGICTFARVQRSSQPTCTSRWAVLIVTVRPPSPFPFPFPVHPFCFYLIAQHGVTPQPPRSEPTVNDGCQDKR